MRSNGGAWILHEPSLVPQAIAQICGKNMVLAQALVKRGLVSPDQALAFLDPEKYTPTPPDQLPDLERGLDCLLGAVRSGKKIAVWGDFDTDGQTATTILVSALRQIGANVVYHIPVRGRDSHGIDMDTLQQFLKEGIGLLLTCDTGTSAREAITSCQKTGVDVIITDHHLSLGEPIRSVALINPTFLSTDHPLRTLSGAGVAYLFAKTILEACGQQEYTDTLLDLVALGIVADLMELRADTRYLVQRGILNLRKSDRKLIRELCKASDLEQESITEEHISFILAPRLNALGRLGDTNPIVEQFLSSDEAQIRIFAEMLEALNSKRKLMCDEIFNAADGQIREDPAILKKKILILSHPTWPTGVLGIVASRISEIYHRPTILLSSSQGGVARGSARSVDGINITELIASAGELLIGFGGHAGAAGLSLQSTNISRLTRIMEEKTAAIDFDALPATSLEIDALVKFHDLDPNIVHDLERLAPFGPGNPCPTFLATGISIEKSTPIGRDKEHLLINLKDSQGVFQKAVWWHGSGVDLPNGVFDLAYRVRTRNFRGQNELQVEWVDYRPSVDRSIKLTTPNKYTIIDKRSSSIDIDHLIKGSSYPDLLIWREGIEYHESPGCDRTGLVPGDSLLIATVPPSRVELKKALLVTGATTVILGGLQSGSNSFSEMIRSLTGLLKHAVNAGKMENLQINMAAILGITVEIVDLGIQYLIKKEVFDPSLRDALDHRTLVDGSDPDIQELKVGITRLIEEMNAYRKYFLLADPQDLIQ